jgi:hypothetical protein
MASESSLPNTKLTPEGLVEQLRVHGLTWESGGAVLGLAAGILSSLAGSVLTAIAWFTGPQWHGFFLTRDGTVLLFLTIPFLIFGAHCLDVMDVRSRKTTSDRR